MSFINFTHRGINLPKATAFKSNEKQPVRSDNTQAVEPETRETLPGVGSETIKKLLLAASMANCSLDEYLKLNVPVLRTKDVAGVKPESSVTAKVGNCLVTSLIDGGQIFSKVQEYIQNAEKSIQVEMFEFQNKDVDGHLWPTSGAEYLPGSAEQQSLLKLLIHKKKQSEKEGNPIKIQVILDAHKWYQDGLGNHKRHYNNLDMIKTLKENGIDVVPYPRSVQGGGSLQHVKMLAVDGKKAILGGMNWGNHSTANHDACVAIETAPDKKNSEVDNIIDEIFNQDWKFAWNRFENTKLIPGPLTEEDKPNYSAPKRKILAENVDYDRKLAELFDNPHDKQRYSNGDLEVSEVNPVKDPKIKILVNSSREYALIGKEGKESVGNLIKEKLNTATSMKAELFVLSHKEIVQKIIERHKEAQTPGGRPFKTEILIHPGILNDFPYCRTAEALLKEAGVPIRSYKVNEEISQRLHAKWAVFDNKDVVIGSANWSAAGLENNLEKGKREDYTLTNDVINEEISDFSEEINFLEKQLIDSKADNPLSFNFDGDLDLQTVKTNSNLINAKLKSIKNEDLTLPSKIKLNDGETVTKSTYLKSLKDLSGYYKTITELNDKKNEYRRGNHECAVAFESTEIANTFLRQFDKDWDYSSPEDEKKTARLSFTGHLLNKFVKAKEPSFSKLV